MKNFNIEFKPMDENDLTLLYQWFKVPHILQWYAKGEKYSYEMIKEKYLPRISDATIRNFIIYDYDKPVGYIQFYFVVYHLPDGIVDDSHSLFVDYNKNEIVGIDLFIADKSYLHTGFSSEALKLFIKAHINNKIKAILVDPSKKMLLLFHFFRKMVLRTF